MAEGKLSTEAKTFVVQSLACFDPPKVIQDALKADFGATITLQGIEAYDPHKTAGRRLSQRWRTLHEETRKAFLEDASKIGISHRTVRLRALQRMAERAESMGNLPLAAQLFEQAAKEVGDSYTNRHKLEHTGRDGERLTGVLAVPTMVSADQWAEQAQQQQETLRSKPPA